MGPKRRIALVGAAIVAGLASLPVTAQAFPADGGTETAQLTTPADGIGMAQTDQLPAAATQADVTVTPLTDEQFFSRLSFVLSNSVFFNFGDRVEACVGVTEQVIKNPNFFPGYTIPKDKTLQLLFLAACLQTALEVSAQQGTAQDRAAKTPGCFQVREYMAVAYKRSRSGYSAQVTPTGTRPKFRSAVRVSCQRTATGLKLKIRPRKRGAKLRSTVGPMLAAGLANPTKASIRLKISFTVK